MFLYPGLIVQQNRILPGPQPFDRRTVGNITERGVMFFIKVVEPHADAVDIGGVLCTDGKRPFGIGRCLQIGADPGGGISRTGVLRQGVVDKVHLLV